MKLKILFIATILSVTALTGCSAAGKDDLYTNAIRAMEEDNYTGAVTLLNQSLHAGTDPKLVYRGLGMAYLAEGNYTEAVNNLCEALKTSNGIIEEMDMDISYYLAVAYYKAGRADEAKSTLDAVIDYEPDSDNGYYLRGRINLAQHNKEAALDDFNKVIEVAPTKYDHYIRICEDLREYGCDAESDEFIRKAMSSGGKLSDYNKGVLEFYLGSYTEARNDLENARKNKKGENVALYLGQTYEALGDVSYAVSLYEEALSEHPENGVIYNRLAMARINQNDYKGALDILDRGIENSNGEGMKSMLFNRIVCYEKLYDFQKAKELMREYVAQYPDDETALRENSFLSTR